VQLFVEVRRFRVDWTVIEVRRMREDCAFNGMREMRVMRWRTFEVRWTVRTLEVRRAVWTLEVVRRTVWTFIMMRWTVGTLEVRRTVVIAFVWNVMRGRWIAMVMLMVMLM
jgi:hypothetical protein